MKNNKKNYLMQMKDSMISMLCTMEMNGISGKQWKESVGLQLVYKYQIKEIYWDDNEITKTTKYRKRIWSALDHYGGNCKYYRNKENITERKRMLLNMIKPNIKEEYRDEVIKA
jgi:hypothetical protein